MQETQPKIIDRETYEHFDPLIQIACNKAAKNGKIIIKEKATA
jgi:hypothetical protein